MASALAGGAALRLHLGDANRLAEQILAAVGAPHIGDLSHDRRRGDRVDRRDFGEGIGHMCGSVVAVHGLHFSCHSFSSFEFRETGGFLMKTVSVLTSVDHPITIFWRCKEEFRVFERVISILFFGDGNPVNPLK